MGETWSQTLGRVPFEITNVEIAFPDNLRTKAILYIVVVDCP